MKHDPRVEPLPPNSNPKPNHSSNLNPNPNPNPNPNLHLNPNRNIKSNPNISFELNPNPNSKFNLIQSQKKDLNPTLDRQINNNLKSELIEDKTQNNTISWNKLAGCDFGSLSKTMSYLSKYLREKEEKLIEILDEVSGDVNDLIEVMKNGKNFLRWTKEDDEILERCLTKKDVGFLLLLRYKVALI